MVVFTGTVEWRERQETALMEHRMFSSHGRLLEDQRTDSLATREEEGKGLRTELQTSLLRVDPVTGSNSPPLPVSLLLAIAVPLTKGREASLFSSPLI
jgi:hypothetical protein